MRMEEIKKEYWQKTSVYKEGENRMNKKNTSFLAVILSAANIVIWTFFGIAAIRNRTDVHSDNLFMCVIGVINVICWVISFFVQLSRYRSIKNRNIRRI